MNNTNNYRGYQHPSRRTSFFFGGYYGGYSPFGAYWGYPVYRYWPSYYSSFWLPWYSGSYYGYGVGYPSFAYQPTCTYYSGYSLPQAGSTFAALPTDPSLDSNTLPPTVDAPPVSDPADSPLAADQGSDFATIGEQEFKAGHYDVAVRQWRHALVDEPGNGGLMMLLAQSLFATNQYDEAAGAVQLGMQMLPPDKWGGVVEHYRELYPRIGDYTEQLRALEAARDKSADKPALRFLLSYHYAYLGYPKEGLKQLDKCLELAPEDAVAKKLHERLTEMMKPKPATVEPKPAPTANPPATTQP